MIPQVLPPGGNVEQVDVNMGPGEPAGVLAWAIGQGKIILSVLQVIMPPAVIGGHPSVKLRVTVYTPPKAIQTSEG